MLLQINMTKAFIYFDFYRRVHRYCNGIIATVAIDHTFKSRIKSKKFVLKWLWTLLQDVLEVRNKYETVAYSLQLYR